MTLGWDPDEWDERHDFGPCPECGAAWDQPCEPHDEEGEG